MKYSLSLAFIIMFAVTGAFAKDGKNASGKTAASIATVKADNYKIAYGQSSKNGRVIFGDKQSHAVVTYGEVWRPGTESQPVEITVAKDCLFAGHQLKAGAYTMLIIPHSSEWMIILNSQLGQKGAFNYEKVRSKDVLLAAIAAKTTDNTKETFTINSTNDGFSIEWDQMAAYISMKTFGNK